MPLFPIALQAARAELMKANSALSAFPENVLAFRISGTANPPVCELIRVLQDILPVESFTSVLVYST